VGACPDSILVILLQQPELLLLDVSSCFKTLADWPAGMDS
jgi:hypothetical protein